MLERKNEEMYFCNTYNKRESKYLGHLLIEYRHSCYYLQKPCPKHLNLLFMQIYDPLKYLHSYINNNRGIEGKHEYIKICYFSKYRSGSKISPINEASPDVSSARAIHATPPKANETAKNFSTSGDSRNTITDKIK